MDSKIYLIAIAIIGLMFLSIPADATALSFHKSQNLLVYCGSAAKDTAFTETNNLLNGAAECGGIPGGGLMLWDNSLFGYPTNVLGDGEDSWIDLGATYNVSEIDLHYYAAASNQPSRIYASNTTNLTGFSLIASFNDPVGAQWVNKTFTQTTYRYFRFEKDTDGLRPVDEIVIQGNPLPNITSWSNSYTNNASLNIAPPAGQNVIFSITATSQTPDYYIWTVDNVNQSNNFSSIVLSFNTLQHVVNATVSNANGTSTPVSWVINGAAYQLPSAPTIPNGYQCGVMFDKTTQPINSIGYILTNTSYGFLDFNSYRTEVYSTKIPLLSTFQMDKSNSTEIFPIIYPLADVYTVQVVKSVPLFGDSVICTNTTQATMGASSLFVPSIVSVGTQNNISFILGYTPNHSTDTINIRTFDANGNMESIYGVSDASTVAGVQYYQNVRYLKEGAYTTKLTSSAFGTLDSKASEAVLTPNNPTRHILPPSFINVSQPFYAFGDTIEYGYQIDDANYTNYSQYIAVYNWNQSVTTRVISLCGKQWNWLVHLPIINGIVLNENCDTYDLQDDGFLSGLNKLSLRGQNSTSDIELAYVNFTIASTDAQGWGLSVDKNSACVGDTIRTRVITPGSVAGSLKYGYSGSLTTVSVNSTMTLPKLMTREGDFLFELYDGSSNLRMTQTVNVKSCGVVTPVPTAGGAQKANDLANLLDSNLFWAMIFIAGLMIAVAVAEIKSREREQ